MKYTIILTTTLSTLSLARPMILGRQNNLQTFTGALGGITATPITDSGDAKHAFSVKGDTFVNLSAAIQRSCDQQFNACANAANGGNQDLSLSACSDQQTQCNAAASSTSANGNAAASSSVSTAAAATQVSNACPASSTQAAAASTSTSTSTTSDAQNLQTFTGALGGITATPITNSGDTTRPFSVKGDTFVNLAAALQRSCDQQFNACANAANGGDATLSLSACSQQQTECNASASGN